MPVTKLIFKPINFQNLTQAFLHDSTNIFELCMFTKFMPLTSMSCTPCMVRTYHPWLIKQVSSNKSNRLKLVLIQFGQKNGRMSSKNGFMCKQCSSQVPLYKNISHWIHKVTSSPRKNDKYSSLSCKEFIAINDVRRDRLVSLTTFQFQWRWRTLQLPTKIQEENYACSPACW